MTNHEFNTVAVADGTEMGLYVAFPEGQGSFPAIIVLQEGFGLTQHIRNVAERLCKEGYAVVAPELYHRTGHRVEASYDDFPKVMEHFQANAVLPLSAAVSYYGGGIDQLIDEAPNLHGSHLFFWGGLDAHIPVEKVDPVIKAVKDAGKDYTNVVISYADHGFNCDDRASYQPLAAKEAWAHSLAFFVNRLK